MQERARGYFGVRSLSQNCLSLSTIQRFSHRPRSGDGFHQLKFAYDRRWQ